MTLSDLTLKDVRKALVALVTLASILLAQGLVPDAAQEYVVAAIALLNAYGVYKVRNGDKVTKPGHLDDFADPGPFAD